MNDDDALASWLATRGPGLAAELSATTSSQELAMIAAEEHQRAELAGQGVTVEDVLGSLRELVGRADTGVRMFR